jgi:hypothetical protein
VGLSTVGNMQMAINEEREEEEILIIFRATPRD